jgi:hypothetical protein
MRAAQDEARMRARRAAPSPEAELLPAIVARERERRAEAEHRVAALERMLAQRTERWTRAYAEIDEIRDEIGELRRVFAHIESAAAAPAGPAGPIEADRLSDALARLREQAAPPEGGAGDAAEPGPAPTEPETLHVPPGEVPADRYAPLSQRSIPPPGTEAAQPSPSAQAIPPPPAIPTSVPPPAPAPPPPATTAWLWPIFRAWIREDPLLAGQLLLHLLPAWPAVHPLPVACDLILGDRACVQVTVGAGNVDVRHTDGPRRPEDVHFQVRADLARLARTVAAGRVRRRLGRGMARVSGDHDAFARMALLVRSPLTLAEVHAAGVRLDPELLFCLIARMIDPAWTVGERFTLAHRLPHSATASVHLEVRDGAPVSTAGGPPAGPADTTVVAEPEALPGALATASPAPVLTVEGRPEPLARLAEWLERAQSA